MQTHRFDTAIGPFSLDWDGDRLLGARIDEASTTPVPTAAAPDWVLRLAEKVKLHLSGQPQNFTDAPFDFSRVTPFQAEVCRAALRVPSGQTLAYGELAASMGRPRTDSRAVGSALGGNPWLILVPCHRFVSAKGHLTGFSAPGGVQTKLRLLQIEGARLIAA